MFVAHSFAGYLWTRQYIKQRSNGIFESPAYKYFILFGMFCAVLPDFDLLYFYTLDHRQHPHHQYWTHMPIFWLAVSIGIYTFSRWVLNLRLGLFCAILLANTWLHLILDTPAGGIYWLYPFNQTYVLLIPITPRFEWWVWNFIFHWIFLAEVAIVFLAAYNFHQDHNIWIVAIRIRRQMNAKRNQILAFVRAGAKD